MDGHTIRAGKEIIDRTKIGKINISNQINQYKGHTYLNNPEKFRLDSHKLMYHLEDVIDWRNGERIAPIQIDMGLTRFCNMKCIYCIGVTQNMKKGAMIKRDALFQFIHDCNRLGVKSIAFIGDGEPTLNPSMYDAVILAKTLGIDVGIGTNGLLLDMKRAPQLLACASFIRINLSAADPHSFEKIHQYKAEAFNLLIEKIKALVKMRNDNNYSCTIGIQMVLIPENFDQVIKLAELGSMIGVDYLQIKQCSDTEYGELGIDYKDYERVKDDLKKAENFSTDKYLVKVKWNKIDIEHGTPLYKGRIRKYDICYGTPFLGQISGDGKVYPCGPFFAKERFCMGDINKESYYDIVKSDRYWEVHQDIEDNIDVHHDCTIGCRQDYINKFLWDLKNPPEHINFI